MQITKYGHSCLHVVDGTGSVLIDPGVFSEGWESLSGLTGVLITHAHADHLDTGRLGALVAANADLPVYADPGAAGALADAGVAATAVTAGTTLDLGLPVEVGSEWHAVVHEDIPRITNVSYRLAGRLFHPGDSLRVPDEPVEILALPVMAPWMAVKEAIDYFRAVSPQVAIPIHEKLLANTGMVYGILQGLGPADARWLDLDSGEPATV